MQARFEAVVAPMSIFVERSLEFLEGKYDGRSSYLAGA